MRLDLPGNEEKALQLPFGEMLLHEESDGVNEGE